MSSPEALAAPTLLMPDWILLHVAEHADMPTLLALMCTNKRTNRLLTSYERSICRIRLSGAIVPPISDILSTATESQDTLPVFSFDAIAEFQRRHIRIAQLVQGDFLAANDHIPQRRRARYLAGLERAVHICDHVADLSVEHLDSYDVSWALRTIRESQVKFIKTLSRFDLAFLAELASVGGSGWARSKGHSLDSDPDAWDKVLAFEELTLRRGSLLLWGIAMGPESLRKYVDRCVIRGADEIRQWETGLAKRLPSLRLTVVKCFASEKKCTVKNTWQEITRFIAKECERV